MEKILEMYFKTENGKKTLTIAKPNQSLDLATVTQAQNKVEKPWEYRRRMNNTLEINK